MKYLLALGIITGLFTFGHAALADEQAIAAKVDKVFARLDANKDGKISREEAQSGPRLASHFDAVDADKDGYITRAELQAFFAKHGHHRHD
jgi:Ca2+-binding EF-hand superfamily protein